MPLEAKKIYFCLPLSNHCGTEVDDDTPPGGGILEHFFIVPRGLWMEKGGGAIASVWSIAL